MNDTGTLRDSLDPGPRTGRNTPVKIRFDYTADGWLTSRTASFTYNGVTQQSDATSSC